MSLPSKWVDALFAKLTVIYGQSFLRQWEGVPIEDVKADWGSELAGFEQAPKSITYGLSVVNPDKPPNVLQFKALCLKAPQYTPKALPAPDADPEVVKAAMQSIQRPTGFDPRDWAWRLKDREASGDRLTLFQRSALREALEDETQVAA